MLENAAQCQTFDFIVNTEARSKGLVLDWSGTTADAYVIAPAIVFAEVFRNQGVEVSMNEARGPMGLRKDLHIEQLTLDPVIRERWNAVHGRYPDQSDVDRMFDDFVPAQVACLPKYTDLLPGTAEVTQRLQKNGLRIGVSTGFTRVMVTCCWKRRSNRGSIPTRRLPVMKLSTARALNVHGLQKP